MPAVTLTTSTSRSSPSKPPADLSYLEEEVFEQNGDVEEIFAIDNVSVAGSVYCFIQVLCRAHCCLEQARNSQKTLETLLFMPFVHNVVCIFLYLS